MDSEPVAPVDAAPLPAVPGPTGRRVLLFVFVALIEYWIAPLLFGVVNYAGLWSAIGYLLFGVFAVSLVVFVVLPILPHLRDEFGRPHRRLAFASSFAGALALGLFASNSIQFLNGGAAAGLPSVQFQWGTIYTPFGPWTSALFVIAPLSLTGTLNVAVVTILTLLAFLWSSALLLGPLRPRPACALPAPRPETRWRGRFASVAAWGPFGLISACPSCAPAYVAWLALVAPGPAASGYAAIPLVPWIGLAGLLYLASFALTLWAIGRSTRPAPTREATVPERMEEGVPA